MTKTAIINIKTDIKIKKEAQKIATDLGLNLSLVINAFLRQFTRTKAITFALEEKPSKKLLADLAEAETDVKKGRVKTFRNSNEAINFLDIK